MRPPRLRPFLGRSKKPTSLPIDASRYPSLGALLADALVQYKSEVALIEQRRKKPAVSFSYHQFAELAGTLAGAMKVRGIAPGDRIAVLMRNQPRWLLSAYAAMHQGATLVPLDYKLEPEDQAALLKHAEAKLLLVDSGLYARFRGPLAVETVVVNDDLEPFPEEATQGQAHVLPWDDFVAGAPPEAPPLVSRSREDLACIVYSSGTSGRAKGCMLTHGAYLSQYQALRDRVPMRVGDRFLSILPTNHAIDFMAGFIGPLCSGAAVVHQRTLRPDLIKHTLKTQQITHMAVVPMILEGLGQALEERIDELDATRRTALEALTALHGTMTAKAPWPAASRTLLSAVHKEFGGCIEMMFCGGAFVEPHYPELFHRFGIPVLIGYGLTEACTVATLQELRPFRADSVGLPVQGVEVRIAEPNGDGIGEVLLRGETVMQGYLKAPELTAEAFADGGFLRTGDLGRLDPSGHLHLVGRRKNMIVTAGGKNIYPEDVESTFAGVPAEELAVFGSTALGADGLGNERLVLVMRIKDGTTDTEALHSVAEANQSLPPYKRIGGVVFSLESFPRTASMKVKRHQLAASLSSDDPTIHSLPS